MARTKPKREEVVVEQNLEMKRKKPKKVVVIVPKLNVRKEGSMDAEIIRVAEKDEVFEIITRKDGWGQIGENEWISLKFTEIFKD